MCWMEVTVQSFSAAWFSFMSPERLQASRVSRTNRGRSYHGIERRVDENKGRGLGSKLTFSSIHGCKLLVSVRVSASSCSNDIRQLSIMRRFAVHAHEMLNTAERQISCVCVCVCTHHRGCFTHSPRSWRAGQLQWMMKGGSHAHRYRCRVAVLVTGNRSLVWCLLHVLMLRMGCMGGAFAFDRSDGSDGAELELLHRFARCVEVRCPSLRPQSAHVAL